MQNELILIGAANGLGFGDAASGIGPRTLQEIGLDRLLTKRGLPTRWGALVDSADNHSDTAMEAFAAELARQTAGLLSSGALLAILGGDHSSAIGGWRGLLEATAGDLGLLWIDAHMDAHTPTSSPSGALHGMPLACLMGHGESGLCDPPQFDPARISLIGVRS